MTIFEFESIYSQEILSKLSIPCIDEVKFLVKTFPKRRYFFSDTLQDKIRVITSTQLKDLCDNGGILNIGIIYSLEEGIYQPDSKKIEYRDRIRHDKMHKDFKLLILGGYNVNDVTNWEILKQSLEIYLKSGHPVYQLIKVEHKFSFYQRVYKIVLKKDQEFLLMKKMIQPAVQKSETTIDHTFCDNEHRLGNCNGDNNCSLCRDTNITPPPTQASVSTSKPKTVWDLDMHQSMPVEGMYVTRVPNGFIYLIPSGENSDSAVFVPFKKLFNIGL